MSLIKTALITTAIVLATCFVIAKIWPGAVFTLLNGEIPSKS